MAWGTALKKAEIEDFRFRDLSHPYASWYSQAGTSSYVLKNLDGRKIRSMVNHYAEFATENLA